MTPACYVGACTTLNIPYSVSKYIASPNMWVQFSVLGWGGVHCNAFGGHSAPVPYESFTCVVVRKPFLSSQTGSGRCRNRQLPSSVFHARVSKGLTEEYSSRRCSPLTRGIRLRLTSTLAFLTHRSRSRPPAKTCNFFRAPTFGSCWYNRASPSRCVTFFILGKAPQEPPPPLPFKSIAPVEGSRYFFLFNKK